MSSSSTISTFHYIKIFNNIAKVVFTEKKNICNLILPTILLILGSVVNITVPWLFKSLLETISQPNSWINIVYIISIYSVIYVISNTLPILKEISVSKVKEELATTLTHRLFSHFFTLPANIYTERKTGEISNIFTKVKNSIPPLFWSVFFHTIPLIIEVSIVLLLLVIHYPILYSSILFIALFVMFVFTFQTTKYALKIRANANKVDKEVDAKIIDWMLNYEAIKCFGITDTINRKCATLLQNRKSSEIKVHYTYNLLLLVQSVILGSTFTIITLILGYEVYQNQVSFGDFVLFHSYLILFINPVISLGYTVSSIKKALVDIDELLAILSIKSTKHHNIYDDELIIDKPLIIEFKNVSFKHKDKLILDNVSFTIISGVINGLIGKSGEGKSSIILLILKIHQIDSGQILINNIDINHISNNTLYKCLNILPQNTYLFNDTISQNIAISNPNSDIDKIHTASYLASIDQFINTLPLKYDNLIAERGLKLSGGEKQRIALARFFLSNSQTCLLDEYTTALDPVIENTIQKNVEDFVKNKTTLIITHKRSLLKNAAQILKLENGKITTIKKGTL